MVVITKTPKQLHFGANNLSKTNPENAKVFGADGNEYAIFLLLSGLYRRPWNFTESYAIWRAWVITTDRELGALLPHPAPKEYLIVGVV